MYIIIIIIIITIIIIICSSVFNYAVLYTLNCVEL
jgi:hypothetical protein